MLELELENLDGLDESLHSYYEEKDGVFRLKVNGLDDAIAGKTTLIKEREARKAANERLRQLEEAQQEVERKRLEAEQEALKKEGKFQELYDSEQQKTKEAETRYQSLMQTLANDKIETVSTKVGMAIATSDPADQELVIEQVRKHVEYVDGKAVYKIGAVEVDEKAVMEHISKKYPKITKGLGGTGGGASGSKGGGAVVNNPWKKGEHFNLTEQGKIAITDPALAAKLQAEA